MRNPQPSASVKKQLLQNATTSEFVARCCPKSFTKNSGVSGNSRKPPIIKARLLRGLYFFNLLDNGSIPLIFGELE
jgi:hypothetical protein